VDGKGRGYTYSQGKHDKPFLTLVGQARLSSWPTPTADDVDNVTRSRWAISKFNPQGARDCEWLPCIDGKARPAQSGIQPLAHGVPARVAKLRAIGNAIVPQVAAEFIKVALAN
jgi:hypothetical protein